MLKSCKYCGRYHDSKYDCGKRPKKIKIRTENSGFRSTAAWTRKSIEIRERDRYLCQCCLRNYPGTERRLNYEGVEVHHIEPVETAWENRLNNENLISLCRTHHEMAESGKIENWRLHEMARENEIGDGIPPGEM